MNPYTLALDFFAYGTFLLALLMQLKRNDEVSKTFSIFCLFVSIWGIFITWQLDNNTPYNTALLATRIADTSALFIPPSWLHFIFTYLGKQRKKIITFLYLFSFSIACFGFSPLFVQKLKPILEFQHYVHPGPLFHLFTIEFFIAVAYGFAQLFLGFKKEVGIKRSQIIAIIWATFFGFFGGGLTFFIIYDIPVPQYAMFLMPLYPFVMAYAMIRRGFMEPEEILALQREKLALLGLMSSSINHEIKNPLFIMQEFGRKAETQLKEGKSNDEVLTTVEKVNGQLIRVRKMVERITEFGHPDSAKIDDVFLEKVIDNCLFFASQEFKYLSIETEVKIEESAEIVKGSRSQLEQVFLNLTMNAFYAMPSGGKLTIQATRQDNQINIVIADTGTGILKAEIKNIFKPFYTTKEKTGTGLGLHIVKTLVEQNGGKISVESEINKGTKFILKFPMVIGVPS